MVISLVDDLGPRNLNIYPSDRKMRDSEPHILFQFKEENAAE
ncbi:hypothetical protein VIBNISOn1_1830017 [Vibrio nigripulchritudo SOn1]|uniref:Uncharacterized protein n=1 Tax=Vibrio nigripulchritudo SOn1 TaxID=1238450 RepID=A0AAV2VPJ1_9VIBR|nr:hypothetical protein VIBNISOn1_1830017 [Vibrio nigripulchritudo SOn1]